MCGRLHQRHGAADLRVASAVDVAERAAAQPLEDVVVRDLLCHRPLSGYFAAGRDGRSSSRLGRLRGGKPIRSITARATSSGASFQSAPETRPPKPVAVDPGSTQLTRMLSLRSSCIIASLKAVTAALVAQYAAPPANGWVLERLPMLMIQPPPRARSAGIAARQQWNSPFRLVPIIRFQSSNGSASTLANVPTPALLTRMSRP